MDSFQIETAQNIRISQQVASIGDRILAFIIDVAILIFYYIFVIIFVISNIGWSSGISQLEILALSLPLMFYTLLFETFSNGRTVGKMALNIRVVKIDGTRPRFSDYLIRWLFRIFDIYVSSGGLAVITILLNGKGQRFGDIATKTTVIKEVKINSEVIHRADASATEETYQPVFSEVVLLKDEDVQTIREVYWDAKRNANHRVILKLNDRLLELLQIKTELKPMVFIETVLKDYQHFSQRGG